MAKLLVADDNALSVHFFMEAVALAGHEPMAAADGNAACSLALTDVFDLMLLDARMPGLDGAAVLQVLRLSEGPNRATPAILTTAEGSAVRENWLDAGFVDVIYKPIEISGLHAMISRCLNASVSDKNLLDDDLAAQKTGGDASIVAALRSLFAIELEALPSEIDGLAEANDFAGFLDRLHRLDASAGFCGAPRLTDAIKNVRVALDATSTWPSNATTQLLGICAKTRALLP